MAAVVKDEVNPLKVEVKGALIKEEVKGVLIKEETKGALIKEDDDEATKLALYEKNCDSLQIAITLAFDKCKTPLSRLCVHLVNIATQIIYCQIWKRYGTLTQAHKDKLKAAFITYMSECL